MASSDPELILLYLNRLVSSLAPAELGPEYASRLVKDLTTHITQPSSSIGISTLPLPTILDEFKRLFLHRRREEDWKSFQAIVDALIPATRPEDLTRYLVYLSRLAPLDLVSPLAPTSFENSHSHSSNVLRPVSPFASSPRDLAPPKSTTMHDLIKPYYETLDEGELVASLRHILVGQDTKILRYLRDQQSIEIPATVNTSYTQLLTDILEPALLSKGLHAFLDTRRSTKSSPIKTAYLSFVDAYLMHYADVVESLFRTAPESLLGLLDSLDSQIHSLRFLSYLKTRLVELNGFDFLQEVYKFSQFGDHRVSEFASKLFKEVSIPYYQYIEHWLIKGELIDENTEFFVFFDSTENHINDIIRYNAKKLPIFIKLDEEIFTKAFQLGKTLVFLEKYCKELDWVNDFALRYHHFIFTTYRGIQSMDANTLQVMIDHQYDEVVRYNTLVMQSKYLLFSHLLSMKRVMLMEAGDFINAIEREGADMFGEPALSLTSARLSELLIDSISQSALRFLPPNYQNRVDAKILDLSHGNIGWDVFTLAYSVPEPPLDALLNYKDQTTQYLRLFNFLWSLRHYQFLLREDFLQFQDYHKSHLRLIKNKVKGIRGPASKLTEHRVKWLAQALRVISLVRHRISVLVDAILSFVSFDLIENSFKEHIERKIFKSASSGLVQLKKGGMGDALKLTILDSTFLKDRNELLLLSGLERAPSIELNTSDLTIDELTSTHSKYLRSVSECKLLREDVRGRLTGKSFVQQIFELLELAFSFLGSSGEFGTTLSSYVNILQLKSSNYDLEEDWDDLHHRLNLVKTFIQTEIYTGKFQPWLKAFSQDMRAEVDLREFSKMI